MNGKAGIFLRLLAEKEKIDIDAASVILTISQYDNMRKEGNERHYFSVGLSGLRGIINSLSFARKEKCQVKNILDFASGYGRVLRFLKAYFPEAKIVSSDIDEKAIKFCKKTFGVDSVLSNTDFEDISFNNKFDLIWCGSIFTHIRRKRFEKLLDFLLSNLADDGILIFTTQGSEAYNWVTHGRTTYGLPRLLLCSLLIQYSLLGYGYVGYPSYVDYGISLTKPSWIMNLLKKSKKAKILSSVEHSYDNHQDIITCSKT